MKQYLDKTFLQLGRGFQFSEEPPATLYEPQHLQSRDSWTVIGSVLARCRRGELDVVEVLPDVMARDDAALVWNACIELIGFAGSMQLVFEAAERFLVTPQDLGVQWYISTMLINACDVRAVDPLLVLHRAASAPDARRHIEHCLSILLEDLSGAVEDGPVESEVADPDYPEPFTQTHAVLDLDGYVQSVRARATKVLEGLDSPSQPMTAGAAVDVLGVAKRLYERLRAGDQSSTRMEWERMFFEANTGIDCSDFYQNNQLQRLAAMAVLEEFLDSGRGSAFAIGTRYFFGYPIAP